MAFNVKVVFAIGEGWSVSLVFLLIADLMGTDILTLKPSQGNANYIYRKIHFSSFVALCASNSYERLLRECPALLEING